MSDSTKKQAQGIFQAPHQIRQSVIFLLLSGMVAAACYFSGDLEFHPESGVTMELPSVLGGYYGEEQEVSLAEKTILPLDTEFARKLYHSFEGDAINCQIVLSGMEKRSIHRPEICLPGQGWTIKTSHTTPVPLANGKQLEVTQLNLVRPIELTNGQRINLECVFMYWFVGTDRITAKHLNRVIYSSYDRVFNNTTHRWAYVVVSSNVTAQLQRNGKDFDQTVDMLKTFISDIFPSFHKEKAVESL